MTGQRARIGERGRTQIPGAGGSRAPSIDWDRWRPWIIGGVAAILVLVAVAYVVRQMTAPQPGEAIPILGRDHLASLAQPHAPYNSVPATSGWHFQSAAPWGIYDQPVPDEVQVHNLEHGGVIVQYNCPEGCPDLVGQLTQAVRKYPTKIILAPYPNMPYRIALTAWGRLLTMEQFDEGQLRAFAAAYMNRGPENAP